MPTNVTTLNNTANIPRLQDTAPESFYGIVGLLIVFIFISTRATFKALATYRAIKGTPASLIRSAAQGSVELNGVQETSLIKPLISPLTLANCTWYEYVIQKKVIDAQNNIRWETIYRDTSVTPILLRDKTGECWVFPKKAQVSTPNIFMRYENTGTPWRRPYPANQALRPFFNFLWHAVNILTLGALSAYLKNKPYRHIESIMQHNDPLYALGFFHSYHARDQHVFKTILEQANTTNVGLDWIPSAHTPGTKHTLSASSDEKNTPFLLSSKTQHKLIQEQLGSFLVWLGIDLALIIGLAFFMGIY
jgi:hypothetical protein